MVIAVSPLTSHLSPLTSHLRHQASGILAVAQIRPTAYVRRGGLGRTRDNSGQLGTTREDVWAAGVLCQGDAGARVANGWQRAASSGRGTSPLVPLSPLVAIWHRTCLGLSYKTKKGGVSRWLT